MTPITVNGHNLLVIDVPKEAGNFRINSNNGHLQYDCGTMLRGAFYALPAREYSIIGTISKDGEFSFDPSDYVEDISGSDVWGNQKIAEQSFISLLESAGIYLSNPMGEKPIMDNYLLDNCLLRGSFSVKEEYSIDLGKWNSYESKTIKGQALILKQEKV